DLAGTLDLVGCGHPPVELLARKSRAVGDGEVNAAASALPIVVDFFVTWHAPRQPRAGIGRHALIGAALDVVAAADRFGQVLIELRPLVFTDGSRDPFIDRAIEAAAQLFADGIAGDLLPHHLDAVHQSFDSRSAAALRLHHSVE